MSFTAAAPDTMTAPDPRASALPRAELLQLYAHALDEYRFNVRLGAARQTLFVALAVTSALAAHALQLALAYAVGVAVSVTGAFIAHRSHRYYVAARGHFRTLERALGLDVRQLGVSTTPGMRATPGATLGSRPWARLTITRAVVALLLALAVIDVAGAALAWWGAR